MHEAINRSKTMKIALSAFVMFAVVTAVVEGNRTSPSSEIAAREKVAAEKYYDWQRATYSKPSVARPN
jgi:hypothetical protein